MNFIPLKLYLITVGFLFVLESIFLFIFVDQRFSSSFILIISLFSAIFSFYSAYSPKITLFKKQISLIRSAVFINFLTGIFLSFSPYLFRFAMSPLVFLSLLLSGILTLLILLFTKISESEL